MTSTQTKEQGMILQPNGNHRFDCWADAGFCGNWHPETPHCDPTTSKSHTGCGSYAGCTISWASKMQTQTANQLLKVSTLPCQWL